MTIEQLGRRGGANVVYVDGRCRIELPLWKFCEAVTVGRCGTRTKVDAKEADCFVGRLTGFLSPESVSIACKNRWVQRH